MPEARGGVALGVEVDDEDPVAQLGEGGAQVHGGRGLAHATLLVGDGDDPGQLVGPRGLRRRPPVPGPSSERGLPEPPRPAPARRGSAGGSTWPPSVGASVTSSTGSSSGSGPVSSGISASAGCSVHWSDPLGEGVGAASAAGVASTVTVAPVVGISPLDSAGIVGARGRFRRRLGTRRRRLRGLGAVSGTSPDGAGRGSLGRRSHGRDGSPDRGPGGPGALLGRHRAAARPEEPAAAAPRVIALG